MCEFCGTDCGSPKNKCVIFVQAALVEAQNCVDDDVFMVCACGKCGQETGDYVVDLVNECILCEDCAGLQRRLK